MPVTGQKVFEIALTLIDETTQQGKIDLTDLTLRAKAPNFLTILQAELMPDATTNMIVNDLADDLLLPDRQCLLVLPYGLAAHLVIQDDAGSASFFQQRYEEMRAKKRATIGQTLHVLPINGISVVQDGEKNGMQQV